MLLADTWVFGSADHPQTLPSVWVVGAVFAVAVAGGRRAAVTTGIGMGFARYVGLLPIAGSGKSTFDGLATMVLLGVSGWAAGYLMRRLAETDRSIASYRAREEVTRTLHDGVLQTLAVIQRRSHDTELVTLARRQERELRDYLFGRLSVTADVASGLRAAAHRAEQRYDLRVEVVIAPDLPAADEQVAHCVAAAAGEALTNAAKHGGAATATIYAEPSGGDSIFVSVKDDGSGFDPATTTEGEGLRRSVRGRLAEIGGRVEIDGRPGKGTEIRMWV
jgi:signal transduction histidine kinase